MSAWFRDYRVSSNKFMLNYSIVILFNPSRLLKNPHSLNCGKGLERFSYMTHKYHPMIQFTALQNEETGAFPKRGPAAAGEMPNFSPCCLAHHRPGQVTALTLRRLQEASA